ncbi:hypothetical protein D3C78_1178590 [compost metagenome]
MEKTAALEQGDRLLAGIDQFGILLARRRCRAHAENTVLAVQKNLFIRRQVVGDLRGNANAQIDVGAFRDIARNAFCQLLMSKFGHGEPLSRKLRRMVRRGHQALYEDPWRNDVFRIQFAQRHHAINFSNGAGGGHGHDRPKVAPGFVIPQVAPAIGLFGLDQGEVRPQRQFEHVVPAVDLAGFFALRQLGAVSGGCVKPTEPGTGSLDAGRQITLRDQFQLQFAAAVQVVKYPGVRLTRE